MSIQMAVRIDDENSAFVDTAVAAGEGSRADVINRAIRQEMRRRAAQRDARIYASTDDRDLDTDDYAAWSAANADQVLADLD